MRNWIADNSYLWLKSELELQFLTSTVTCTKSLSLDFTYVILFQFVLALTGLVTFSAFYQCSFLSVPPSIDRIGLDMNPKVIENGTVIINCPASGIPTPGIAWLRNDQIIDPLRVHNMYLIADGRQLRINNAQITDQATYRCLVTNKAGKDYADFDLEVQGALI